MKTALQTLFVFLMLRSHKASTPLLSALYKTAKGGRGAYQGQEAKFFLRDILIQREKQGKLTLQNCPETALRLLRTRTGFGIAGRLGRRARNAMSGFGRGGHGAVRVQQMIVVRTQA